MESLLLSIWVYTKTTFPPMVVLCIFGVIGYFVYKYFAGKKQVKRVGNTELILMKVTETHEITVATQATVEQLVERVGNVEENGNQTRKEVTQIRAGCLQRESSCNSKFDTLFDKFNNMPVIEPKKNGKAKQAGSVLVVDDEYCITSMIKQHLEAKGYTVRTANNYREAKTAIEENYYNWAIIDVVLKRGDNKGNNGYRLWEVLHKQRKDQTKKILMSGYSPEDVPIPTYLQKHLREDMVFIGKENLCDTLDKKMV